jgi:uncharacterized protein YdiU (UPF0061 family)
MPQSLTGSAEPSYPANAAGWRLEHTYAGLPSTLHSPAAPTTVLAPRLLAFNRGLAESLGLSPDALAGEEGAAIFAGNRLPPGATPIAQAYAGHQFGHFTALGDGRAVLLGEQVTPRGERFDVQLKGSGPTPYSRRGDGRAAVGPMLREYLISEAMHALGIPTTRSLAVAATGEIVRRQRPLAGAVLTRVAASHIRVGTFEWAAARRDDAGLRALVDYTLRRHYPHLAGSAEPARELLAAVIGRQAALLAQWQLVGFVHGVMNTDNMALSGETIDYGPCAFMDAYDPATVFSSIDESGRYAYANQPRIAQWNLARLAEALLPALHADAESAVAIATPIIEDFAPQFQRHWLAGMRRKLGLLTEEPDDSALVEDLLGWMQRTKADFTNTFAELTQPTPAGAAPHADAAFSAWHDRWHARLGRQPHPPAESARLRMASNPAVIPRNHLVEAALAAAEEDDLGPFERLLTVLAKPFDYAAPPPEFRSPPPAGGACYRTFCGT